MQQTTLKIAVSAAALATLAGLAAADGGDRPPGGLEAYKSASRTYPADVIPPDVVANARATFEGPPLEVLRSDAGSYPAGCHCFLRGDEHDGEPGDCAGGRA
jgi:hypothetical protein